MTDTTTEVHATLDAVVAAHAASDASAVLAATVPDAVRYTLAPPLAQTPDTAYGTVSGLERWFATFDGGVELEQQDRQVTVAESGDLAYATMLTRMTATPAGAPEPFSFWFRSTVVLRRQDGRWVVVHQHDSTPFYMDGSMRAATDLQP